LFCGMVQGASNFETPDQVNKPVEMILLIITTYLIIVEDNK